MRGSLSGRLNILAEYRWQLVLVVAVGLVVGVAGPGFAQQPAAQRLTATLTGQAVLPGPGAKDAQAELTLDLHEREVCWDLRWEGIEPTGAAIHRGAVGQVGAAVIRLFRSRSPVTGQTAREDCTSADPAVIQQLRRQPAGFYAQLTTQSLSRGAVRGQLANQQLPRTGGSDLPSPWALMSLVVLLGVGALAPALADRRRRMRAGA